MGLCDDNDDVRPAKRQHVVTCGKFFKSSILDHQEARRRTDVVLLLYYRSSPTVGARA
jgi:hypothetical protein